jgi:hypothetical protein
VLEDYEGDRYPAQAVEPGAVSQRPMWQVVRCLSSHWSQATGIVPRDWLVLLITRHHWAHLSVVHHPRVDVNE